MHTYVYASIVSFIAVSMNSRDQCKIMRLCKTSRSIKQPYNSVCLKSIGNALSSLYLGLTKWKIEYFNLQQAFKISEFCLLDSQSAFQLPKD